MNLAILLSYRLFHCTYKKPALKRLFAPLTSNLWIAVILGITILILSISAGCVSGLDLRMFTTDFSYGLSIYTDEPITNATFYIPLPVKNGMPMVGDRPLVESDFNQGNIVASFTQSPPGLDLTGAYPVPNNTPWFVKLTAAEISPGLKANSRIDPAYDVSITDHKTLTSPILFLNTLMPVGNESVFLPKLEFNPSLPTKKQSRSPDWLEYDDLLNSEKTMVYANYTSTPSVEIHGGSNLRGYNSWKESYDASISNFYSDGYQWSWTGEAPGWQIVTGSLYSAGIYPNLTHPEWQRAIQRSQQ